MQVERPLFTRFNPLRCVFIFVRKLLDDEHVHIVPFVELTIIGLTDAAGTEIQ